VDTATPWQELAATDAAVVAAYAKLEAASRRGALAQKERELIQIAVAASTAHLFVPGIRLHMQRAIDHGASREEILDVLRLASVIGIHSLIPAVELLVAELGGADALAGECTTAERDRAAQLQSDFRARRGFWPEAWNNSALLSPAFLEAYAAYSSLPKQSACLPEWLRELILLAVDISPTHFHQIGARAHLQRALGSGATREQVLETIEIAALIGFNTCVTALPLLESVPQEGHPT
jgi:alkylhydroperoxidase/carboxymuconolactone decarboxylase family protein YurZ